MVDVTSRGPLLIQSCKAADARRAWDAGQGLSGSGFWRKSLRAALEI
jgi:hypothetical protein